MVEKDYLSDVLMSQKQISTNYNTFANECSNPQLRTEFMNILNDEHYIQADIYTQMSKRGWYQVKPADMQEINQVKQKFQNQNG